MYQKILLKLRDWVSDYASKYMSCGDVAKVYGGARACINAFG